MSRLESFYIPFICHMIDLIKQEKVNKTYTQFSFDFIEVLYKQQEAKPHSFLTQIANTNFIKPNPIFKTLSSMEIPMFVLSNLPHTHIQTLMKGFTDKDKFFLVIANCRKPLFQRSEEKLKVGE